MQVENRPASYLASLHSRAVQAAANTNAEQTPASDKSGNQKTPATKTTKAAAAANATPSPLSSETLNNVLKTQMQPEKKPLTLAEHRAKLYREHYESIASDPNFAAKEAKLFAISHDGVVIDKAMFNTPEFAGREYEILELTSRLRTDPNDLTSKFKKQRMELYEREVAKGTPPAQIIKKILEFNISLPDSYTEGVLNPLKHPPGHPQHYKSSQQKKLDTLNAALEKAAAQTKTEAKV